MSQFFIRRPVFAWVIAIFIILFGLLSIPKLPIARFPSVAPPQVNISATYPGATAKTINDSVVTLIERELSGVKNLLYYSSTTDTSGTAQISATFKPGTDVEMAQVDVQNKIKAVEARLPQVVRQQGLQVEASSSGFLMLVGINSPNGQYSEVDLSDYLVRNVVEELKRVEGVGKVQSFGAEKAMRIWVDPNKLVSYGLSISDVNTAIRENNVEIAPGRLGDMPAEKGQLITVPLSAQGQLGNVEQFRNISLKSKTNGSVIKLSDVAKVEIGSQAYNFAILEDGKPATAAAIQLSPGANAVKTAEGVKAKIEELKLNLPEGMQISVPYDTAPFVKISIEKVIHTLLEAMVLVFIVMYLFLHNVRYTLIPAIVAPIALLGTFAVMLLAGFSINVLTMFGMVLAIGIIVDDAIVVVENVERIMATEGLSPKEATSKAMKEITSPIIGITLVLAAVFLPMAFASGSVGIIYQQFTLTMSVSILFSALLALILTPALCATILKPIDGHHQKKGFFAWFDRSFDKVTKKYELILLKVIKHSIPMMVVFVVITGITFASMKYWPTAFMPEEDQGWFLTSFQLPSDATTERTRNVVNEFESSLKDNPNVKSNTTIMGWGFSGSGQNVAVAFTTLTDFKDRTSTATEMTNAVNATMANSKEGATMAVLPPQLMAMAAKNKKFYMVWNEGLPQGDNISLKIDREKLNVLGVKFSDVSDIISTSMGSMYINDFPNQGRMQQVIVQVDAKSRMQLKDILNLKVAGSSGQLVSLSEVVTPQWSKAPQQYNRYNGRPSLSIAGIPNFDTSSGDAMREMEQLIAKLPKGIGYEWTGISLQEKQSEYDE